jgi:drug/metabolite transporter (DMT)-like permease
MAKNGVMNMDVHAYSFYRYLVATVSCLLIMAFKREYKIDIKDILPLALIGFFFVFLQQKIYLEGAYLTTAGNNAVICATIPIITIFINGILKYEVITVKQITGTMVSLAGVVIVIFFNGGEIILNVAVKGDLMVLVSMFLWSAYIIANKKYIMKYSSELVVGYTMCFSLVFMYVFWYSDIKSVHPSAIDFDNWINIILTGMVMTTVVNIMWNQCVKEIGSVKASVYYNISPILSIAIGIVWLNEQLNVYMIVGALLTISGVFFSQYRVSSQEKEVGYLEVE